MVATWFFQNYKMHPTIQWSSFGKKILQRKEYHNMDQIHPLLKRLSLGTPNGQCWIMYGFKYFSRWVAYFISVSPCSINCHCCFNMAVSCKQWRNEWVIAAWEGPICRAKLLQLKWKDSGDLQLSNDRLSNWKKHHQVNSVMLWGESGLVLQSYYLSG